MAQNVLITGAAGFIGGSLLADLLARTDDVFKNAKYFAAARGAEQVDAISKLGIDVLQVDLTSKESVEKAVLKNEINIVVHTAGSIDPRMAVHLIEALGQRGRLSGDKTTFIHSSVASMYTAEGGWPFGEVKDTDPLYEKEKEIGAHTNPVRGTNIRVVEEGKAQNVTTLIVAVPMTYGRGTGEVRKLSVNITTNIRTSMKLRVVHRFDKDATFSTLHISDLTALYCLLLENVLLQKPISNGEEGYYFAVAHRSTWSKVFEGIAKSMYARGLVDEPTVKIWASRDEGADHLGFPRKYIEPMAMSSGQIVPVKGKELGWEPKWDDKMFLDSMDDEVLAVQEGVDVAPVTLFDLLKPSSGN